MPNNSFIRFFDKEGNDMNLGATSAPIVSLYDSSVTQYEYQYGRVFFPKVSVGLIESQQLYLLQEVTGPTASYELRKVEGEVTLISGDPSIEGIGSDFTALEVGTTIKIESEDYTIASISGATSMVISPTPTVSTTTFNIYYYDYLSYNQLRTSIGTFNEYLEASFVNETDVEQTEFFLYSIDYSESAPYIRKHYSSDFQLVDGSSDTLDPLSGRVQLNDIVTLPTSINLGFSSGATVTYDDSYEENMVLNFVQEYAETLVDTPILSSTFTFTIGGTGHSLYDISEIFLQGVTGPGSTASFFSKQLTVLDVYESSGDTVITTSPFDFSTSSYSDFRIFWKNRLPLAKLNLYGESEAEDERFKLVLENFGKRIDSGSEFIFRESDISEELTNYEIVNKKRKELLLEGDNIYPYMGSYKALINIINFFGYYDLRIKEYFLNVDQESSNYGKYLHLLIPRDDTQRREVKKAWQIVPSKIYKKTALFGLFYDLNKATDEEDIYGIPTVEDAFDFSPEEVLIKLFGLKEVLKKQFLPLNARIYDITGEGIYFERIRVDSWADNLNHLVLDLGKRPVFNALPVGYTYVTDLRRMDAYYVEKFAEQGLTGFLGPSASDPGLTALGYTGPLTSIDTTNVIAYEFFKDVIYDEDGNLLPPVDESWQYMPPGVRNPDFNEIAARMLPLPDDQGIISGGPVLLEATFDISWDESYFTWAQLGILGPTGAPLNINIWTWDSIGRGEYIEMRWTVEKNGANGFFYDSGRKSIDEFVEVTRGATAFTLTGKMRADVSGGSLVDVDILSAGYGYTASPNIYIPAPDQPGGTPASITCTVSGGYINSVSFTGGTGYSYAPTITVEPPGVTYEPQNRILQPFAFPYEGDYQIGLYIYDICNNYTVDFQKYAVKNKKVDFVSSFRRETPERTWQDFSITPPPIDFNTGAVEQISWEDVTGPWYYPIHVNSSWGDANLSWESLNYSQFKDQTIFEYNLSNPVYAISREPNYIVLSGDMTGNLNNLSNLNVGDFLFMERYESDLIEKDLIIPSDSFNVTLRGVSGPGVSTAYITGATGATFIGTSPHNVTNYLSSNDRVYVLGNGWKIVDSVGSTGFSVTEALESSVTGATALSYTLEDGIQIGYTSSSPVSMNRYSRIMITNKCNYNNLDPSTDFYDYANGLTVSGGYITVLESDSVLQKLILRNSSLQSGEILYANWGIFSGTYALEISNISLTGSNTMFRLKDPNKELYGLDGNFTVRFADYDVDYAEGRIGADSLTYENLNETTWSEHRGLSWYGLEYHGGALCGFVIPFVAPGGYVTIDENPTFVFSGDQTIENTRAGLEVAATELQSSLNEGISKYSYSVLPETDLYILDGNDSGDPVPITSDALVGSNSVILDFPPYGGTLKIPAEITATVSGGLVTSVSIVNRGWGYSIPPTINVITDGCLVTPAEISCTIGLGGYVDTVTIVDPGSGYDSSVSLDVEYPTGYELYDNYIWTGNEWVEVASVNVAYPQQLLLGSNLLYDVLAGTYPLLPYDYHKQQFLTDKFQQFYYFIQGKANTPSNEMLSYVNMGDGVQSEWAAHPDRSYTYPLRNSILYSSIPGYDNLSQDYLYNTWVYEGSDYPPLNIYPIYESDKLSISSRIPYSTVTQSCFSFIDTVVSSNQRKVAQCTPVVFHFDNCAIPGKREPLWTITDDNTGKIEVMSQGKKLMWNFTKPGNFTVTLKIVDANGNVSVGEKNSFIVVDGN